MFSYKAFLMKTRPMLSLWRSANKASLISKPQLRAFSTTAEVENLTEEQKLQKMTEEERIVYRSQKFGADLVYNSNKHAFILSFPWNFNEVIADYEQDFKPLPPNNYWSKWVENREITRDFSELFRVFHQSCAIPDEEGIDRVCEPKLAKYMKRSISTIHFHGMDIEMANLRVHQPKIDILNVEVHYGLKVDRSLNQSQDSYNIENSTFLGVPLKVYTHKEGDRRSVLDHLNSDYKPYLVSITTLIHSPMKLFVYNQNRSKILFGSSDEEIVKNVVKFEINVRWLEFFKLLPVRNKPLLSREWRITDYNNVMNENPYF